MHIHRKWVLYLCNILYQDSQRRFCQLWVSRMVFLVLCFHAVWHPPKCGFMHSQFLNFWGGFVCYLKAFHFSLYSSAALILGVRSPWWLNVARWHMMFVGPQFGTCIISPFWCLELWGGSNFGNCLHLCCTVSLCCIFVWQFCIFYVKRC